jgi:hypothetical protein
MRLLIITTISALCAGSAFAQEAPLSKVYACAGITGAQERLACFDAAVAGLKTAEASGGVAVVTKQQIADAEKQSFGRAAPSLSEVTRGAAPTVAPDPLERVQVTIAEVTKRPKGLLRFTLANGQVWEEFDNTFGRLIGLPLQAEIRKGALGGFMMKVGDKPMVRVRRVK